MGDKLTSASMPAVSPDRITEPVSGSEEIDVEEVEAFIHNDADILMDHFKHAYDKVINDTKRPRVLIAGVCGAGKSSIINSVFGSETAKEGAGRPVTQNFQRFDPEDKPITLYDSKGLEVGMKLEEFIDSTLKYFTECNGGQAKCCMEQQIDVVWYIVNSAAARFQDFEEKICKQLFKNIPIIFILNKADISTNEQKVVLRNIINSMQLHNCIGIFNCVTRKYGVTPTNCEKCGSADLVVYRRDKVCFCEECSHKFSSVMPSGLDEVMAAAFTSLPKTVKAAFVAAQKVSFQLKDMKARKIVQNFYYQQARTYTPHGLLSLFASMLTKLSFVWDFKEHAHLSASHIAKDVVGNFSFRDKIFLFMHKNKHQRLRSTAIGILWNRCVRKLAAIMLIESVEGVSKMTAQREWPLILSDTFELLSSENIDTIEARLRDNSIEIVMEADFDTVEKSAVEVHKSSRSSIASLTHGQDCWDGWDCWLSTPDRVRSAVNSPFATPEPETEPMIIDVVEPKVETKETKRRHHHKKKHHEEGKKPGHKKHKSIGSAKIKTNRKHQHHHEEQMEERKVKSKH